MQNESLHLDLTKMSFALIARGTKVTIKQPDNYDVVTFMKSLGIELNLSLKETTSIRGCPIVTNLFVSIRASDMEVPYCN